MAVPRETARSLIGALVGELQIIDALSLDEYEVAVAALPASSAGDALRDLLAVRLNRGSTSLDTALETMTAFAAEDPDAAASVIAMLALIVAERGLWADSAEVMQVYERITASGTAGGSTADPPGHRFAALAAAALIESHTDPARTEAFSRLDAALATPVERNLMSRRHALALIAHGRVLARRGLFPRATASLIRGAHLLPAAPSALRSFSWALTAYTRYRSGDIEGARSAAVAAEVVSDEQDAVWIRGISRSAQALAHTTEGQWDAASAAIARAEQDLGHQPSVVAELLLAEARAASAPAPSAGSWRSGLTEQQIRVAELIARGRTSAEIAEQLFLSPKTVDFHAANVVQKLGLTGRRQIAGVLRAADARWEPNRSQAAHE